jgi:hypothetical protein
MNLLITLLSLPYPKVNNQRADLIGNIVHQLFNIQIDI